MSERVQRSELHGSIICGYELNFSWILVFGSPCVNVVFLPLGLLKWDFRYYFSAGQSPCSPATFMFRGERGLMGKGFLPCFSFIRAVHTNREENSIASYRLIMFLKKKMWKNSILPKGRQLIPHQSCRLVLCNFHQSRSGTLSPNQTSAAWPWWWMLN